MIAADNLLPKCKDCKSDLEYVTAKVNTLTFKCGDSV